MGDVIWELGVMAGSIVAEKELGTGMGMAWELNTSIWSAQSGLLWRVEIAGIWQGHGTCTCTHLDGCLRYGPGYFRIR
jgi:hypothetical protein